MTRCCSSFSNCSPEQADVTITNETHVYEVGGNQIGWRQERFAYADLTVAAGSILVGTVVKAYTAYATLASIPVAKHAVQVFFADGSVPQRPLVGLAGVPTADDATHDYFVVGQNVYLTFAVVDGDSLFVHYVGTPLAGTTGISTGDLDTIALSPVLTGAAGEDAALAAQAPAGWCMADGYTPYLQAAYPALYAYLVENDLLSENSVETGAAGANGTSNEVDADASFVIRYLVPYSYGTQGTNLDDSVHPARSLTHRVVIKA